MEGHADVVDKASVAQTYPPAQAAFLREAGAPVERHGGEIRCPYQELDLECARMGARPGKERFKQRATIPLAPMAEMDAQVETKHVRDFPQSHRPERPVRKKLAAPFHHEILAAPIRKRLDPFEECRLTQFVRFANEQPGVGTHKRLLGGAKHRCIFRAGISNYGRGHGT